MIHLFKPHISMRFGSYVIRRLTFFGWEFLDKKDNMWWKGVDQVYEYCRFDVFGKARLRLDTYNPDEPD